MTLYFPVSGTDGVVSEVRSISFSDQVFSHMVVAILRELAQGPDEDIASPALPLLSDLLTAEPPAGQFRIHGRKRSSIWNLPIIWTTCWRPMA